MLFKSRVIFGRTSLRVWSYAHIFWTRLLGGYLGKLANYQIIGLQYGIFHFCVPASQVNILRAWQTMKMRSIGMHGVHVLLWINVRRFYPLFFVRQFVCRTCEGPNPFIPNWIARSLANSQLKFVALVRHPYKSMNNEKITQFVNYKTCVRKWIMILRSLNSLVCKGPIQSVSFYCFK